EVESSIAALEEQLSSLTHKLEDPLGDPGKVQKLGQEYVRVQNELDELMEEWGSLHELVS
ncbi:MAG TPA: ABC transporter C-terminal domain-containing protein, partial [Anaerolineales bacterium]